MEILKILLGRVQQESGLPVAPSSSKSALAQRESRLELTGDAVRTSFTLLDENSVRHIENHFLNGSGTLRPLVSAFETFYRETGEVPADKKACFDPALSGNECSRRHCPFFHMAGLIKEKDRQLVFNKTIAKLQNGNFKSDIAPGKAMIEV